MANEISVSNGIRVTKNGLTTSPTTGGFQADQTGDGVATDTVAVTTAAAQLTLSITPGFVAVKNLDADNYVDVGPWVSSALHKLVRLNAGESAVFRVSSGVDIGAQANTATCSVRLTVVEA